MAPRPVYILKKKINQMMSTHLPPDLQIFLKCKPDRVAFGLQIINRFHP